MNNAYWVTFYILLLPILSLVSFVVLSGVGICGWQVIFSKRRNAEEIAMLLGHAKELMSGSETVIFLAPICSEPLRGSRYVVWSRLHRPSPGRQFILCTNERIFCLKLSVSNEISLLDEFLILSIEGYKVTEARFGSLEFKVIGAKARFYRFWMPAHSTHGELTDAEFLEILKSVLPNKII